MVGRVTVLAGRIRNSGVHLMWADFGGNAGMSEEVMRAKNARQWPVPLYVGVC